MLKGALSLCGNCHTDNSEHELEGPFGGGIRTGDRLLDARCGSRRQRQVRSTAELTNGEEFGNAIDGFGSSYCGFRLSCLPK
jgi:hypothetical protein